MRKFPYCAAALLLFFLGSCSLKSMNLAFEAMLEAQVACLVAGDTCVDASTTPTGDVTDPTVAITNLPTSGRPTVETGFLFGTSSDDILVSSVEIRIDGGTYTAATGTTSWSFALPSGSSTWRKGSLHSINIRSIDSSGNISSVLSLHIRKGYNRDLNGDGYADIVALAPGDASGMGMAYIFYGGSSGISATDTTMADHSITGQGRMGYTSAMGDVNGDGYGDLAVGASDYSGLQGITYIFHGSSSGITTNAAASADLILNYTGSNEFGYSIALGDVNGDGYDDLANGAYRVSGFSGLAFIYYSTGSGGISSTAGTTISGPGSSNFACGIALGDINGDGFSDLIVGGNAYAGGSTGGVWIFHSSGSAGVTVNSYTLANTTIVGETASNFGIRIYTGDVNGDGYADLAVGAPQYGGYFGRSYVFNSTGTTSGITVSAATSANTIISGFSISAVGLSVVLGDINGDGYDDFATGAPNYSTSQGRIYINLSDGAQVSSGSINIILGEAVNQAFGNVAMISDINGDGMGDLVAGAYVYPDGVALSGRTYIFHSVGSGYAATSANSANTIISGSAGSEFGSNLVDANIPKDLYPKFLGVWAFGSLENYRIQI
ncbi:hypothetical protein CH352_07630 [Leptospira hartskeerlii]|uniref:VCBS repeat-containing protein n=1 Tax=Leptospira hartskeerlii TaxID=2023177 RepID=A0A2M9XFF7_9LEPT|nr:FG-GAP-like repeat-containing protein [Leptospira hartskeerlii]PJZ26431.1 hypothetical protein CH357_08035 [Leptospira hartskeerlii]PJZ34516.1 hypothetical protein CH352_07630 [Leptospira hartskeerlii]